MLSKIVQESVSNTLIIHEYIVLPGNTIPGTNGQVCLDRPTVVTISEKTLKDHLISSQIKLLEAEIEREKEIIKKYPNLDGTSNKYLIIGKEHFLLAKKETISHLQEQIELIKKMV